MLEVQDVLIAFAAGAASFASPCMLPLVPGFVAWAPGGAVAAASAAAEDPAESTLRRPVGLALLFVAGFTIVFVALGVATGAAGSALTVAREPLQIVGGILIAALGLFMLAGSRLPLPMQRRIGMRERRFAPTPFGALGFGAVFGAAWSPCIGPTLGAILTLSASNGGALQGAVLLAVFAAGLGVPFVLLAAGVGSDALAAALRRHTVKIQIYSGAALIIFGALLATGVVAGLSSELSGIPGLEL